MKSPATRAPSKNGQKSEVTKSEAKDWSGEGGISAWFVKMDSRGGRSWGRRTRNRIRQLGHSEKGKKDDKSKYGRCHGTKSPKRRDGTEN